MLHGFGPVLLDENGAIWGLTNHFKKRIADYVLSTNQLMYVSAFPYQKQLLKVILK